MKIEGGEEEEVEMVFRVKPNFIVEVHDRDDQITCHR